MSSRSWSTCATAAARWDDIDHLGNRRVRCVGELAENQYRTGLARIGGRHQERLQASGRAGNPDAHDLINSKPISAA